MRWHGGKEREDIEKTDIHCLQLFQRVIRFAAFRRRTKELFLSDGMNERMLFLLEGSFIYILDSILFVTLRICVNVKGTIQIYVASKFLRLSLPKRGKKKKLSLTAHTPRFLHSVFNGRPVYWMLYGTLSFLFRNKISVIGESTGRKGSGLKCTNMSLKNNS